RFNAKNPRGTRSRSESQSDLYFHAQCLDDICQRRCILDLEHDTHNTAAELLYDAGVRNGLAKQASSHLVQRPAWGFALLTPIRVSILPYHGAYLSAVEFSELAEINARYCHPPVSSVSEDV